MDCGEKFVFECKKRGCKTPYGEGLKEAVADIDDIEVFGSGAFFILERLDALGLYVPFGIRIMRDFSMLIV